ncbi:hypothetical protein SAMN05421760_105275 [Neptunomonas antarctica]|uniref:Uncharacterized protein n=1 Tax=Neptunomonas antarctica TaxID=619304 RepID=A0A1N7M8W7_9GAMM|nr:hypothetical protein SAMN05421760_105275 [Neptunomonas antarctica]
MSDLVLIIIVAGALANPNIAFLLVALWLYYLFKK